MSTSSGNHLNAELARAYDRIADLETALDEYRRSGQKALELAIEEVKTAALKNFLGNLAGFVTTPLTVMKASILALRDLPEQDTREEQWRMLESQVGTLERLFENMLLMVRLDTLEELELGSLNLNRLAQQVYDRLKPLAEQRQHRFTFQPNAGSARVIADNFLLKSAIRAVVTNALDFTPAGGVISLTTEARDGEAIIEARDNGIGIDDADLPHIFKRFWWASRADYPNPGSVGLGLALAQRIVDLHHGRIEVESTRDQGSVFWIVLPLFR